MHYSTVPLVNNLMVFYVRVGVGIEIFTYHQSKMMRSFVLHWFHCFFIYYGNGYRGKANVVVLIVYDTIRAICNVIENLVLITSNSIIRPMEVDVDKNSLREIMESICNHFPEDQKYTWKKGRPTLHAVNNTMPELIQRIIYSLNRGNRYRIKGQSGNSGNWTKNPSIAIMDPDLCTLENGTVSMKKGIYPVYLISESGDKIYLSLGQATTDMNIKELDDNVIKIRSSLDTKDFLTDNKKMNLGADKRQYARASIAFKEYSRGSIPDDDILIEDLENVLKMYDQCKSILNSESPTQTPYSSSDIPKANQPSDDFMEGMILNSNTFLWMKESLMNNLNIILQGPPGVGKTFISKRLAYSVVGAEDDSRIKHVQFHSNYGYEEFIYGLCPNSTGTLSFKSGVFVQFCEKASSDPDNNYVFIIDEINRADIGRVFGETIMLIEKSHRNESLRIMYNDYDMCVPSNIFIIGTMNTSDRSIAIMDYALRRRFAFIDVEPSIDIIRQYNSNLANVVSHLNSEIAADSALGKGFCIGHSFFMDNHSPEHVVKDNIIPLISEYWYDRPELVKKWSYELLSVIESDGEEK